MHRSPISAQWCKTSAHKTKSSMKNSAHACKHSKLPKPLQIWRENSWIHQLSSTPPLVGVQKLRMHVVVVQQRQHRQHRQQRQCVHCCRVSSALVRQNIMLQPQPQPSQTQGAGAETQGPRGTEGEVRGGAEPYPPSNKNPPRTLAQCACFAHTPGHVGTE